MSRVPQMFRSAGSVAFALMALTLASAVPALGGKFDKPSVSVRIHVDNADGSPVQDYSYAIEGSSGTGKGSFEARAREEEKVAGNLVEKMTEAAKVEYEQDDVGGTSEKGRAATQALVAEFRNTVPQPQMPPGTGVGEYARQELERFAEWRRARTGGEPTRLASRRKRVLTQEERVARAAEATAIANFKAFFPEGDARVVAPGEGSFQTKKVDNERKWVVPDGAIQKYNKRAAENISGRRYEGGGAWELSRDAAFARDGDKPYAEASAYERSAERWAAREDPRFEFKGRFTGKVIETRDYEARPVLGFPTSRFTEKFFAQSEKLARAGMRGESERYQARVTNALGERRYALATERTPPSMQDINRYNFRSTHSSTSGAIPTAGPGIVSPTKP